MNRAFVAAWRLLLMGLHVGHGMALMGLRFPSLDAAGRHARIQWWSATLLRRLESGWRRVPARPGETERDYQVNDHPLPDFVPQQLFGDLNLPEVEV